MARRRFFSSSGRYFPDDATIKLNLETFKESSQQRVGEVEIHFLNMFYKCLQFVWREYDQPGSIIVFSNSHGEELFSVQLGDTAAFFRLTKERKEIVTGFCNLFHARERHLEGYDGNGGVPLSIPSHLKSGSNMKVAV